MTAFKTWFTGVESLKVGYICIYRYFFLSTVITIHRKSITVIIKLIGYLQCNGRVQAPVARRPGYITVSSSQFATTTNTVGPSISITFYAFVRSVSFSARLSPRVHVRVIISFPLFFVLCFYP